jgi:hypothetical protein
LPIASRHVVMPAACIHSRTCSPASRSAGVAKRRVSRSGSSLNVASTSARCIAVWPATSFQFRIVELMVYFRL